VNRSGISTQRGTIRATLVRLCLALLGGAGLIAVPASSYTQDENLAIRLPNPDGRDPVFDQARFLEPVSIEFMDLAETTQLSLADSAGTLRLINFWATWCTPCVKELPSLAALAEQHAATSFQVMAISLDRAESTVVSEFLATLEVQGLQWFIDPSRRSGQAADVFVLPTSVIVDKEGRELGRVVGSADWTSQEASSLLHALLEMAE